MHFYPWAVTEETPNSDETPPRGGAYANVTGLVPCSPDEADGSPPEWVDRVGGFPELEVQSILISDGRPTGIRFQVGGGLRVVVESSDDLKTWIAVGSAVGVNGLTTWAPGGTLETLGRFFRVAVRP